MNDFITILIGGLIGLFLGPGLSIPIIKKIIQIHRALHYPVDTIPLGQIVEITGKAESEFGSLCSPLTQTPCVFWHVEILRSTGGEDSHWETIVNETSVHPFNVKDKTGKIAVFPADADLLLHDDLIRESGLFGSFSPKIREEVDKFGVSTEGLFGLARPLQIYEQVVKSGETVYILGKTKEKNGQPIFSSSKDGSSFLISDRSQFALLGTLYTQVITRVLILVPLGAITSLVISKLR